MSTGNDSCLILLPETTICGIGGDSCVSGECVCKPGFTNIMDFAIDTKGPCGFHILTIRLLWIGVLAIYIALSIFLVTYLVYRGFFSSQKFAFKDPAIMFSFGLSSLSIANTICACLKIYDPEYYSLGNNLMYTVIFVFGLQMFWIHGIIFLNSFLVITMKNLTMKKNDASKKRLSDALAVVKKISPILAGFNAIFVFMPLFLAVGVYVGKFTTQDQAQIFLAVHMIGIAATEIILGFWLIPTFVSSVSQDIKDSIEFKKRMLPANVDEQAALEPLKQAKSRMYFFRDELKRQAISQSMFSILFGAWPLLGFHSSYFFPITTFVVGIISFALLNTLSGFWTKKVRPFLLGMKTQQASNAVGNSNNQNASSSRDVNVKSTSHESNIVSNIQSTRVLPPQNIENTKFDSSVVPYDGHS